MKKIISFLLALVLLLALASCGKSATMSAPVTEPSVTDDTTLPLYWPPLPEETEATEGETQPPDIIQPPDEEWPYDRDDHGSPSPTTGNTGADDSDSADATPVQTDPPATQAPPPSGYVDPNGTYDSKNEVALYIYLYGCLPDNYITKRQAEALGWSGGSVERYAPGKCIGGDRFYNNEGLLPRGHTYYECDIGTLGKSSRGAKRIVYSTDGLIYYTSDHYKSFTLLYGTP